MLSSIVGKGNHSANHIQKIKPAVENICRELGLNYHTEQNEGRIYVDLTGGQAQPPQNWAQPQPHQYNQQQYGQPQYETAYPMGGQPSYNAWQQQGQQQQYQQGQQPGNPTEQIDYKAQAKKYMPMAKKIFRFLKKCFQ